MKRPKTVLTQDRRTRGVPPTWASSTAQPRPDWMLDVTKLPKRPPSRPEAP